MRSQDIEAAHVHNQMKIEEQIRREKEKDDEL
jgi:hypothetical protein